MDVGLVITDEQLAAYIGGMQNLADLCASKWLNAAESDKTAKPVCQEILDIVLGKLAKRTPPILEGDIADPTELKYVVACGTLELLYLAAPWSEGSANMKRSEKWGEKFADQLENLLVATDDEDEGEAPASNLNVLVERA